MLNKPDNWFWSIFTFLDIDKKLDDGVASTGRLLGSNVQPAPDDPVVVIPPGDPACLNGAAPADYEMRFESPECIISYQLNISL